MKFVGKFVSLPLCASEHDILFAQILQSNSHLNKEKKSNPNVHWSTRIKRGLHHSTLGGRAKPDWRYGSSLRFLSARTVSTGFAMMRVISTKQIKCNAS